MGAENATLVQRRDLTADVASFLVRPDADEAVFAPGQYASLGLEVEGRPLVRPYSMASPHAAGLPWEFHVRRVHGGALTERLWDVRAGTRLLLGRPRGRFVADPADDRDHLLVATGTGIAPFVALVRDDVAARRARRIVVVHGTAHADELGYREVLAGFATDRPSRVRYLPTISRPADPRNAGWSGASGRAETTLAEAWPTLGLDPRRTVAYLCGNPGMIAAASRHLAGCGMAPADVHVESYWLEEASAGAA